MTTLSEENEEDSKSYLIGLTDSLLMIYDISENRDECISLPGD
jgi:hypothetical protein